MWTHRQQEEREEEREKEREREREKGRGRGARGEEERDWAWLDHLKPQSPFLVTHFLFPGDQTFKSMNLWVAILIQTTIFHSLCLIDLLLNHNSEVASSPTSKVPIVCLPQSQHCLKFQSYIFFLRLMAIS
jgi:hypothetical protein